jgi:hypothetical protein
MKLSKKAKLSLLSIVLIAAVAVPVLAWIASNTLHFSTTLTGSPFVLTILDSYAARNVQSPPYLPGTLHYEEPVVLYTNTLNLANSAYADVRTNYEIWRSDGGAMDTAWVTVHVHDVNTASDFDLIFSLISDATKSGTANNALKATIGPYTAPAHFSADATVTVTFHTAAPLLAFQADVWITVG